MQDADHTAPYWEPINLHALRRTSLCKSLSGGCHVSNEKMESCLLIVTVVSGAGFVWRPVHIPHGYLTGENPISQRKLQKSRIPVKPVFPKKKELLVNVISART